MRKILLHRGAALPTWRASILPALMWLILLAIFPARLNAQEITVNEPSIVVATDGWIDLQALIKAKVVEGISGANSDYSVTLSNTDIAGSQQDGTFYFLRPGTSTVTFTNKESNDISFSIEVTAKYSPSNCITSEYETLYIGESKTVTVPEDYMSLSDFTITEIPYEGYPDADFDFSVKDNVLTLTGVAEGKRLLNFSYRFGEVSNVITIANKPSAGIIVNDKSFTVPVDGNVYLSNLIKNGVVEGVSGADTDFTITSSSVTENNLYVNNYDGYYHFLRPWTSTITYTNKEFPEISFSFEVTAKYGPAKYIDENLGTVYIGEPKTLTIPDDYVPLSDFTVTSVPHSSTGDPDGSFDVEINGNELTITGISAGVARLEFDNKFSGCSVSNIHIAANKPSADDIKVLEPSITIPTFTRISFNQLIDNKIVEGVPGIYSDYSITYSDNTTGVYLDESSCEFFMNQPGTATITYTHKEFPDVKFSIEVTAKYNPYSYIRDNLGSVFVGKSKTLTIPDDYMSLSDFSLEKSNGNFDFSVEGNKLTFTGVAEGTAYLWLIDRVFNSRYSITITISQEPSADNIKVLRDDMVIPVDVWLSLATLISEKVVEGVPGGSYDYNITSSDPAIVECDQQRFIFISTGTATITFTHKDFPEINFSVKITAAGNTNHYIVDQIIHSMHWVLYVGQSKTIVIPDNYLPLTYYTISSSQYGNNTEAYFSIKISENGKEITLTGVAAGNRFLVMDSEFSGGQFPIRIETLKVAVEVNDEGVATAGSQLGVPVTIALPDNIDLTPTEGTQIVWEAEDNDIVEVDPVTGEITPLKLGKTIITVKRVPVSETAALVSRAAGEETLVTIEFWVTELELAEEMTLEAGSGEQLSYTINAGDDEYPEDKVEAQWTSSNPDVATVDKYGYVKALSEGSTVITLSTNLGTKQIIVNVEPDNTPAGTLSISPSDVALNVGSSLSLSAKGAADKKVIWRTSNAFVARIDENGVITGIASGTATITATIEGTSISASTTVTVFANTTGIEETETSEPVVTVNGMTISVSGIDAELPVEIYNVSGGKIASRKGCCSVTVAQSGIYIVRVGGVARKVAVKY